MRLLDEYLRRVEASLRCPAERRPALIEELRAHLQDRAEALIAEGRAQPDAERQALREMGPAWLLALRLSAANGWNATAHVFWEFWAMGMTAELIAVWSIARESLLQYTDRSVWAWAYLSAAYLTLALALPALGFVTARSIRGWIWAVGPAMFLLWVVHQPGERGLAAAAVYAAGIGLAVGAAFGSGSDQPRHTWLGWVSAAAIVASGLCYRVAVPTSVLSSVEDHVDSGIPLEIVAFLCLPWIFGLAAWFLERYAPKRLSGSEA